MGIRSQKDFFSGLMFVVVGIAFAIGSGAYTIGDGARMGPGYFPRLLGIVLTQVAFLAHELSNLLDGTLRWMNLAVRTLDQARGKGIDENLDQAQRQIADMAAAHEAFLEVASDNAPAIALYTGNGWQGAGIRRDYYAPGIDAVVMRLPLRHPGAATEAC